MKEKTLNNLKERYKVSKEMSLREGMHEFNKEKSLSNINMKLKTLKDIETEESDYTGETVVEVNELRREAIKWVKEIRQTLKEGLDIPRADSILEHFFNITEEDLE